MEQAEAAVLQVSAVQVFLGFFLRFVLGFFFTFF
jgi:hypothetical protein